MRLGLDSINRSPSVKSFETVDELMDQLHRLVGDGDSLDALDHGLQCGHQLALRRPKDLELQVAGLLHDIGYDLVPGDDAGHGAHAAMSIRGLLGDRVAALVELHVPAKRYLVTVDPHYADLLSGTSVESLQRQGGRLSPNELIRFEDTPHFADALVLRMADEAAKVPGADVPPLDAWRTSLEIVAAAAIR
jgi:predicted HD phosphohydrolase